MRVLILSVTTGYGHHSTANALSEELSARGADVVIMDLYKEVSQFKFTAMDKGYTFTVKHMQKPFGTAYRILVENEAARSFANLIMGNQRVAKKFADSLQRFNPQVIISTHVLAAQAIDILMSYGYVTVPTFGIVTDYCFHPFWEDIKHIHYIITGSAYLNCIAEKRGIDLTKILPFGLPVRAGFSTKHSKSQARKMLKLPEKTTILVMGGSMGYGNIIQTIREIDKMPFDFQIVCICGKNEKLLQKIRVMKTGFALFPMGFTDNVDIYMDAADCIITKPGGLTVTEVMCKELPMILTNPIPGHEERNSDFLTNCGAAIRVTNEFSISEALYYLFSDPGRLDLMAQSIKLISHPDATMRISDVVMGCVQTGS